MPRPKPRLRCKPSPETFCQIGTAPAPQTQAIVWNQDAPHHLPRENSASPHHHMAPWLIPSRECKVLWQSLHLLYKVFSQQQQLYCHKTDVSCLLQGATRDEGSSVHEQLLWPGSGCTDSLPVQRHQGEEPRSVQVSLSGRSRGNSP